ncbi:hypothetical protein CEXT_227291 [Caerostris extrusa]|uniref:Uncharacterized protein n=1 Tax=Caerostris extrusa TaxID=172846 RepID=A0AAV4XMP8_CAEEX|nr:hypothetical protein CEXT_227291 [Caerostris extrusa]
MWQTAFLAPRLPSDELKKGRAVEGRARSKAAFNGLWGTRNGTNEILMPLSCEISFLLVLRVEQVVVDDGFIAFRDEGFRRRGTA